MTSPSFAIDNDGVAGVDLTASRGRQAIVRASIGNLLEWYDFNIFAFMAPSIAKTFFPGSDPATALLSTFAVLGVGLVVRPLGGYVLGGMGDRGGRKHALIFTILLMAGGTVLIGLLPGYDRIGLFAPALLVVARMMQGFSTGGEWGNSTAFMAEWSQDGKRGLWTSMQQMSNAFGLLLGSAVAAIIASSLRYGRSASLGLAHSVSSGRRDRFGRPLASAGHRRDTPVPPGRGACVAARQRPNFAPK